VYADYLRGIGAIAASTTLVIVSGKKTFTCQEGSDVENHVDNSLSFSEYCPGNRAVVITGLSINAATSKRTGRQVVSFTLAHELGHAEQAEAGELNAKAFSASEQPRIEEQATCYGGILVERFNPTYVMPVEAVLSHTPMDPYHGSSHDQASAWLQGVQTGSCASFIPEPAIQHG
jgi:predicted metalloprotease